MPEQRVTFQNADGETLAGVLDRPAGPPIAYALFAHCFTCSKDFKAPRNIGRALTQADIAVLRFDFTGLGDSGGDFAASNFSGNVADLVQAAGFLERDYEAPAILIGHSLGGTAVLEAAAEIPSAVAVATIAAPARADHVLRLLGNASQTLRRDGEAVVDLGGRPFRIRRQFVDDVERRPPPELIGGLKKALMIFHAPLDAIVDVDNAATLFAAARHPKSFVSLDRADHLLSDTRDSRYVGAVLAAWAGKYLPGQRAAGRDALEGAADEVVARTPGDSVATELVAAGHRLRADEPAAAGGTDTGPSPYDLLAAALASCTTMTLGMYARHKGLPLEAATVRVTHDRIHARDCEDCETREGKIDEFRREITVEGDLGEAQKQRLLEIAARCPVHRSLEGEIKLRSRLAG